MILWDSLKSTGFVWIRLVHGFLGSSGASFKKVCLPSPVQGAEEPQSVSQKKIPCHLSWCWGTLKSRVHEVVFQAVWTPVNGSSSQCFQTVKMSGKGWLLMTLQRNGASRYGRSLWRQQAAGGWYLGGCWVDREANEEKTRPCVHCGARLEDF